MVDPNPEGALRSQAGVKPLYMRVVDPNPEGVAECSVAPSGLMLPSAYTGVSPLPVIFSALRASAALPFAEMCIKRS